MVDGRENLSSDLHDTADDQMRIQELQTFLNFDEKQSLFEWTGGFEQLKEFCTKILKIKDSMVCSTNKQTNGQSQSRQNRQ